MAHRASRWHCQLFDSKNTDNIVNFSKTLKERMSDVVTIAIKDQPKEIQPDLPLILPVQKCTRVGTDIDNAATSLYGIPFKMVAVVVIHVRDEHSLPVVMTQDSLIDEKYEAYGLIVDMAFSDGKLYDCEMNKNGKKRLTMFLQQHAPKDAYKGRPQPDKGASVEEGNMSKMPLDDSPSVQVYFQPGLDKADTLKKLVKRDFLNMKNLMKDVMFYQLRETSSWIVVCEKDHPIQHEMQKGAHLYQNPKLLLVLHKNPNEGNDIRWSEKQNMLTVELLEDHLADGLQKDDDNIRKFKDMASSYLNSGQTVDTQPLKGSMKASFRQCYIM